MVRMLNHELGLPLEAAARAADAVLKPGVAPNRIRIAATSDGSASLQVDLERFLSTANAALAAALAFVQPKRRGRPQLSALSPDPLADAERSGIDLSLLRSQLRRTRAERLEQLSADREFAKEIRRR